MQFSDYQPEQFDAVCRLYTDVFSDSEGAEEGIVIGELAADFLHMTDPSDLFVFVAKDQDVMTGCIMFSRLTVATGISAFLLSPVAVHTGYQKQGVGQALIGFGLDILKKKGVELVFTYGDPAYYGKTGFCQIPETLVPAPQPMSQPEGWLGQSLLGREIPKISEPLRCVAAINRAEYW